MLADTYKGSWVYAPGRCSPIWLRRWLTGGLHRRVGQLCGDREHVFGAKASTTTMWRLVDSRIDAAHLPKVREARAAARAAAWAAGAAPRPASRFTSTSTRRWSSTIPTTRPRRPRPGRSPSGITRCWRFGPPEIAGGEALAGLLRKGNAGSNTAADHISVLEQALAALPADRRPDPDAAGSPAVVVRSDTAGATHKFAQACRDRGVGFSFGFPVDARVWDAVDTLNLAGGWYPAIDSDGQIRDGAWVAEATTLVNLAPWPAGTG